MQRSKVLFENHRFWSLFSEGAELGRVHNLPHLYTSKGSRFKGVSLILKGVKLLNFTEFVSNLKFTSSLLIQQAKLDSRKIFLSLSLL